VTFPSLAEARRLAKKLGVAAIFRHVPGSNPRLSRVDTFMRDCAFGYVYYEEPGGGHIKRLERWGKIIS